MTSSEPEVHHLSLIGRVEEPALSLKYTSCHELDEWRTVLSQKATSSCRGRVHTTSLNGSCMLMTMQSDKVTVREARSLDCGCPT